MFSLYDYLAEFVVVAESDSISQAAARLNLSQPTISKHLSALEAELGQQLLVRTPHGKELTDVGVAVFESGKHLFDIGEEILKAASKKHLLTVLTLVDSFELYSKIFSAIKQFETEISPSYRVKLEQERFFDKPFSALEDDVDIAIHYNGVYPEAAEGYGHVDLGTCSFIAFMTLENPLAERPVLYMEDLRKSKLSRLCGGISLLNHCWQAIRLRCLKEGFVPDPVTQKIFHPTEVPGISLGPNEVFLVQVDSQSVPLMMNDPKLKRIAVADFVQPVVASYKIGNTAAEQFCAAMMQS